MSKRWWQEKLGQRLAGVSYTVLGIVVVAHYVLTWLG